MRFLGAFRASHGWIWMKIGGNQAQALPDLPIQPRNLDFKRKTDKIVKEISNKNRRCFLYPRIVLFSLSLYRFQALVCSVWLGVTSGPPHFLVVIEPLRAMTVCVHMRGSKQRKTNEK